MKNRKMWENRGRKKKLKLKAKMEHVKSPSWSLGSSAGHLKLASSASFCFFHIHKHLKLPCANQAVFRKNALQIVLVKIYNSKVADVLQQVFFVVVGMFFFFCSETVSPSHECRVFFNFGGRVFISEGLRASVHTLGTPAARWASRCAGPVRSGGSAGPSLSECCTSCRARRNRSRGVCCRWRSASPRRPHYRQKHDRSHYQCDFKPESDLRQR